MMSRHIHTTTLTLLIVSIGSSFTLAEPTLKTIFPCGCQAGRSVEVRVVGGGLEKINALHFSRAGIKADHLGKNKFRITVNAKSKIGMTNVWVTTNEALAGPLRFHVDRFIESPKNITGIGKSKAEDAQEATTHFVDTEPNNNSEQAQAVAIDCVIDARLDAAADLDWYRFAGKRGQSLTLACRSHSLDGSADAALTLFGPSGKELLHSDSRQREPVIHCLLPQSGEYRVRVHGRAYQKDDFSFYRLLIHSSSHVVSAFPHLVKAGKNSLKAIGFRPDAESLQSWDWNVQLTADEECVGSLANAFECQGIKLHSSTGFGSVRIGLTDSAIVVEDEPANSSRESAQTIASSAHIAGRFLNRNDVDWFRLSAKKNETFDIRCFGERLGQRMDTDVSIYDEKGKLLLTVPDLVSPKGSPVELGLASLDAEATWKSPGDGDYFIAVRDLYGGSLFGPDRVYELIVKPSKPSFQVFAMHSAKKPGVGLSVQPGKESTLEVTTIRTGGFKGAIQISVQNAPAGVSLETLKLEPKEQTKTIKVKVADGTAAAIHSIRLVAEAEIGSDKVIVPVQSVDIVRAGIARCSDGVTLFIPKNPEKQ
jgi:hypothetical protein